MSTRKMTLAEFRASGVSVEDLSTDPRTMAIFWGDGVTPGRIYAGGTYLEQNHGPQGIHHPTEPYYCTIWNDSRGGTLEEMEAFLYEWAVKEYELTVTEVQS
jgi:hypothetical protein